MTNPPVSPNTDAGQESALSRLDEYQRSERAAALTTACMHGLGFTDVDLQRLDDWVFGER